MLLGQLANRLSHRVPAADHLEQLHLGSPFHLGQDGKLAIARCLGGAKSDHQMGPNETSELIPSATAQTGTMCTKHRSESGICQRNFRSFSTDFPKWFPPFCSCVAHVRMEWTNECVVECLQVSDDSGKVMPIRQATARPLCA